MNDPLIALADAIDWKIFEENFEKYYSKEGRPAKPIRLKILLLMENFSSLCPIIQLSKKEDIGVFWTIRHWTAVP